MAIKFLAIDLAKNVFQLHGVDATGHVILKRRVARCTLLSSSWKTLKTPPLPHVNAAVCKIKSSGKLVFEMRFHAEIGSLVNQEDEVRP